MFEVIKNWFQRYFSDPEAVLLLVLLVVGFGLILIIGGILAPVLASIVIAYLLETWVNLLRRCKFSRMQSVLIAYMGFLSLFLVLFLVLLPMAWKQLLTLFNDLPNIVNKVQIALSLLPEKLPGYITEAQIETFLNGIMKDVHKWGAAIVSASLSSIPELIIWVVYLVVVPLMVFFFLKDQEKIVKWFLSFLPQKNILLSKVWGELDGQIGNYVQGKVTEIVLVSIATYAVLFYFGLKYSVLLSVLVGLSVIIPYVGATVVTIPVVIVAYLQFGFTGDFTYLMIAYFIVQGLDGSLLVPLLFSEAVNLHPIAIIISILIFGGLWGFWGVFFAIPLATLVKAVIGAWPRSYGATSVS